MHKSLNKRIAEGFFLPEMDFQTSRSGGAGGQHVNKVETKVQLNFNLTQTELFTEEEKEIISSKLKNKITSEGILQLQSQEKRSQIQNKELVIKKFYELIRKALEMKKIRKATRPGKGAIEKRIKAKKSVGEKKANRGWKAD